MQAPSPKLTLKYILLVIIFFLCILLMYVVLSEKKLSTTPEYSENLISTKVNSQNVDTVNVGAKKDVLWGAYTGNTAESFVQFQNVIGKRADINAVFVNWDDPFPSSVSLPLKDGGQTLLIFWEQYNITLDQIISGKTDGHIKKFAKEAKDYGGKIIIVPFHEMNGDWDPWGHEGPGNTPEKVKLAFIHFREVFGEADNVKWGFAVNSYSVPDTMGNQMEDYYPGDQYVDYVGVDGFNDSPPWQSYKEIFSLALSKLSVYNKPIFIFSFASAPGPNKHLWIQDALANIYANPQILGFVWFNVNKEQDWRIWSDQDSLLSFKTSIQH